MRDAFRIGLLPAAVQVLARPGPGGVLTADVRESCIVVLVRWAADTSSRTSTCRTPTPVTVTLYARPRYLLPGAARSKE
jgi:hypothetical protein